MHIFLTEALHRMLLRRKYKSDFSNYTHIILSTGWMSIGLCFGWINMQQAHINTNPDVTDDLSTSKSSFVAIVNNTWAHYSIKWHSGILAASFSPSVGLALIWRLPLFVLENNGVKYRDRWRHTPVLPNAVDTEINCTK